MGFRYVRMVCEALGRVEQDGAVQIATFLSEDIVVSAPIETYQRACDFMRVQGD